MQIASTVWTPLRRQQWKPSELQPLRSRMPPVQARHHQPIQHPVLDTTMGQARTPPYMDSFAPLMASCRTWYLIHTMHYALICGTQKLQMLLLSCGAHNTCVWNTEPASIMLLKRSWV